MRWYEKMGPLGDNRSCGISVLIRGDMRECAISLLSAIYNPGFCWFGEIGAGYTEYWFERHESYDIQPFPDLQKWQFHMIQANNWWDFGEPSL